MSLQRTITITCDFPTGCEQKFGPKSDELGEARKEATASGWYVGRDDKAYCPGCVAALGIRTRAAS